MFTLNENFKRFLENRRKSLMPPLYNKYIKRNIIRFLRTKHLLVCTLLSKIECQLIRLVIRNRNRTKIRENLSSA